MTEPSNKTSANTCPSAADLVRRGESLMVEFKSDRKCLPDRELVEALAAMANSHGGVFVPLSNAFQYAFDHLLRPCIRLYRRGVSEVYQMARLRHDLADSGVIYGPLWPARGPLMAVYGGLRRLIWSVFGRIRSFCLAFGWFLVGPPRFQPQ